MSCAKEKGGGVGVWQEGRGLRQVEEGRVSEGRGFGFFDLGVASPSLARSYHQAFLVKEKAVRRMIQRSKKTP